jgi:hypothetical protein
VWKPQRHVPPYLAEFVELLAGTLKRNYPGHEYRYAPAVEPPRSAQVPPNAP